MTEVIATGSAMGERYAGGPVRPEATVASSAVEDAELVAVGVGHDAPGDLVVLRSQKHCALLLHRVDGAHDVPVDAVLHRLGLGHRHEVHRGDRVAGDRLEGPEAAAVVA